MKRSQTICTDIHLLLLALMDEGSFADIGHKASINSVHSMASSMPIQRTFAANTASLSHNNHLTLNFPMSNAVKIIPQSIE